MLISFHSLSTQPAFHGGFFCFTQIENRGAVVSYREANAWIDHGAVVRLLHFCRRILPARAPIATMCQSVGRPILLEAEDAGYG